VSQGPADSLYDSLFRLLPASVQCAIAKRQIGGMDLRAQRWLVASIYDDALSDEIDAAFAEAGPRGLKPADIRRIDARVDITLSRLRDAGGADALVSKVENDLARAERSETLKEDADHGR